MNQTTGTVVVNGTDRKVNDLMIASLIDRIRDTPERYMFRPTKGQAILIDGPKSNLFIYRDSKHWSWAADVADGCATFAPKQMIVTQTTMTFATEDEPQYCSQCLGAIPNNSAQYDVCDACADEYLAYQRTQPRARLQD